MKRITPRLLVRWPLPALDPTGGKVSRGSLLIAGGSDEVAGAATLAGLAGLRAGAGTLTVATTRGAASIVAGAIPEARVVTLPARRGELSSPASIAKLAAECDAVVLGPGSKAKLAAAIGGKATWVVDAGAIAGVRRRSERVVLTPHAGEMATLCGLEPDEVCERAAELAVETAAKLRCVIALKGETTYIAAPDGQLFESTAGNHGLGTSGSGDVLAGVIGGLAARGATPLQAAVWGVHLHGRAGDMLAKRIGPLGYLAHELLDEIPPAIARLEERKR